MKDIRPRLAPLVLLIGIVLASTALADPTVHIRDITMGTSPPPRHARYYLARQEGDQLVFEEEAKCARLIGSFSALCALKGLSLRPGVTVYGGAGT